MTQTPETEAELLRDVLEVVRDLEQAYAARYGQDEARRPEDIVTELCGIVRAAPDYLLLPRLAKRWKLTDEGVVCTAIVLLKCCGLEIDARLNHVSYLACGLSPTASGKFRRAIRERRAFGRLVKYCPQDGQLYPSPELIGELSPDASAMEWDRVQEELDRLPTVDDGRDGQVPTRPNP